MDESAVAAKVAQQNLPPQEPELTPGYPEPEAPDATANPFQPLEDTTMTNELMQFFNIQPSAWQMANHRDTMQTILQWARQNADSPDLAGILRVLNHTETILGSRLKSDRLARLYRYIRIQSQKAALAEKERALYGH